MVYLPREDSYLLKKWVEKLVTGDVLDMGTGTGIQAFAAAPKAKSVLGVDADPEAVEYCKNAATVFKNIEFRQSDLFSGIKESEKFDFIIFNPPYLPENKFDKGTDTTGGKEGWEKIEEFLGSAKNYLKPNGQILMVFSSLTNPEKVLEIAKKLGYKPKLLEKKHVAFEDLFVYAFQQG